MQCANSIMHYKLSIGTIYCSVYYKTSVLGSSSPGREVQLLVTRLQINPSTLL